MVPLTSLAPRWIGLLRKDSGEGITFSCPACGPTHEMVAYFKTPLDGGEPVGWKNQTLWEREGSTFETLTLAPSIQYPCWHGWVEGGQLIHTAEATHIARVPNKTTGVVENVALSPRQVAALKVAGKIR